MTTFTVDALGGGQLVCSSPVDGVFVWREMETGSDLTHVLLHSDGCARFGWYLGAQVYQWERYPDDSLERGMYTYVCAETKLLSIDAVLRRFGVQEQLLPFMSGPAILDFPILPNRVLADTLPRVDRENDVSLSGAGCSTPEEFHRLYALALQQMELFPDEFHTVLPFYRRKLLEAVSCYERISLRNCVPEG